MKFIYSLLVVITFCFCPIYLNSTCIIIYKLNGAIYVIADTRSVLKALNENNATVGTKTIDKINNKGKYYFAIAGHADSLLLATVTQTLDTLKPLNENVNFFAEEMKWKYWELLIIEREYSRASYEYYLKNALASVAFFTYSEKSPQLVNIDFFLKEENGTIDITYKIANDPPILVLGIHDHLDAASDKKIQQFRDASKGNPMTYIELMLKYEMSFHKDYIGCPLDKLILTNKGAKKTRVNCK